MPDHVLGVLIQAEGDRERGTVSSRIGHFLESPRMMCNCSGGQPLLLGPFPDLFSAYENLDANTRLLIIGKILHIVNSNMFPQSWKRGVPP